MTDTANLPDAANVADVADVADAAEQMWLMLPMLFMSSPLAYVYVFID